MEKPSLLGFIKISMRHADFFGNPAQGRNSEKPKRKILPWVALAVIIMGVVLGMLEFDHLQAQAGKWNENVDQVKHAAIMPKERSLPSGTFIHGLDRLGDRILE